MKLKIKVTKEILEKSKMCGTTTQSTAENCAIALACREVFPNCAVSVNSIYIDGRDCMGSPSIDLPKDARLFIMTFDRLKYKPQERLLLPELEFEVELDEDVLNSINIDEVREVLKKSKTLELVENA